MVLYTICFIKYICIMVFEYVDRSVVESIAISIYFLHLNSNYNFIFHNNILYNMIY